MMFGVLVFVVLAVVVVVKLRRSNRSKKTHGKLVYQAYCLCLSLTNDVVVVGSLGSSCRSGDGGLMGRNRMVSLWKSSTRQ